MIGAETRRLPGIGAIDFSAAFSKLKERVVGKKREKGVDWELKRVRDLAIGNAGDFINFAAAIEGNCERITDNFRKGLEKYQSIIQESRGIVDLPFKDEHGGTMRAAIGRNLDGVKIVDFWYRLSSGKDEKKFYIVRVAGTRDGKSLICAEFNEGVDTNHSVILFESVSLAFDGGQVCGVKVIKNRGERLELEMGDLRRS